MLDTSFIKRRRADLNLSQGQAAAIARLAPSKWSNLECGRVPNPRAATLVALARALDCRLEELIKRRRGETRAQAPEAPALETLLD